MGSTLAPSAWAIVAAAASACCVARPPCLTGKVVASPAASTPSAPVTRPCASVGRKPCSSRGSPGMAGPASTRKAENGVGDDRAALLEPQDVVGHVGGASVREQLDRRARTAARAWPAPAASPKIHSGSRSGVTSVTVASADAARLARGHDRQLVGGQRPCCAGRHHDDELAAVAARHLGEHPLERRDVGGSAEGQRARGARPRDALRPRRADGRSRGPRRSPAERAGDRRRPPASSPSTSVTSYRRASSCRSSGGGAPSPNGAATEAGRCSSA